MTSLNKECTEIFAQLIHGLHKEGHRKIENDPYMSLVIEQIGRLNTTFGSADVYSLCHYYEQNGDLMRDPEMCFLFMQNNIFNELPDQVFPYSYRQDGLGIDEESITFEPGGTLLMDLILQEKHADFANDWLINIQLQGFLK